MILRLNVIHQEIFYIKSVFNSYIDSIRIHRPPKNIFMCAHKLKKDRNKHNTTSTVVNSNAKVKLKWFI